MSIEFSYLDPGKVYAGRKQFDCEHAVINKFVHDSLVSQVKKNLSVAYVLTDSDHGDRLVGFFTIANHTIDATLLSALQLGSLPRHIPCARLIMLGVDKAYKGADLGSKMMKQALSITTQASAHMGCYGLYLDADPGAVNFYQRLGFLLLEGNQNPNPSPMFIAVSQIAAPLVQHVFLQPKQVILCIGKNDDCVFSPSWTTFQADRGRDFNVIVDGVSN